MAENDVKDNRVFLTPEQANSMLSQDEMIHTFLSLPMVMLGADWERSEIIKLIDDAPPMGLQLTGETAQSMKHGLAVWRGPEDKGEWVFVETITTSPSE